MTNALPRHDDRQPASVSCDRPRPSTARRFAAWVTELLGRCDATEPPISLQRPHRTPME